MELVDCLMSGMRDQMWQFLPISEANVVVFDFQNLPFQSSLKFMNSAQRKQLVFLILKKSKTLFF